ncbi:glycoside hydrolase family 16 protein [Aulographum hederae CBS 113979]|uniref:endo-1,3(4)-beta-glucanase n=1 Tax=Aulographum hederae CBS 113979 TaxID=1176131 RepID=A0A6G1GW82_9PEZI|nr:glycoside hydrolase family 16 protein [Aulographum hederae CBS 113979]
MSVLRLSALAALAFHGISALPTLSHTTSFPGNSSMRYANPDTYDASNFMDKFNVQDIPDPTHGFVTYVSKDQAQNEGLYRIDNGQIYMGVDSSSTLDPNGAGRKSVRLSSTASYNHGLIIGDFAHVPGSVCGSWPAFWMVGPNWPGNGEIDIIEGVSLGTQNQATLHTNEGCVMSYGEQLGSAVGNADCGAGGASLGCGVLDSNGGSFGSPINDAGGAIYATEWTSNSIKVWWWPRSSAPGDIGSGNPDPSGWGTPTANFQGCAFDNYIRDLNIIFDTTFCGDWAGQVWGSSSCSSQAATCNDFVAKNPGAFGDSYWLINSVKVFSA